MGAMLPPTVVEAAAASLARGDEALRTNDWESAPAVFEAVLEIDETPEAHERLALALWWLRDVEAGHTASSSRRRSFLGKCE